MKTAARCSEAHVRAGRGRWASGSSPVGPQAALLLSSQQGVGLEGARATASRCPLRPSCRGCVVSNVPAARYVLQAASSTSPLSKPEAARRNVSFITLERQIILHLLLRVL